jgi:rhamnosyl/mannosyltransferase
MLVGLHSPIGPNTTALTVLQVYKDVAPAVRGGIENQIDLLRRALPEVTTNVIVCARNRRSSSAPVAGGREVRVAELGPRPWSVPLAPALPLWVHRTPADVIHLHMPNPPGEAAVLMAARERPLVVSYHADIVRQVRLERAYRPLVRACLQRADAIVVGSEALAAQSSALQPHRERVRVIRHAVDVGRYSSEAVAAEDRRALRERYGAPLVIAVGRLVYYKGFEVLIEAARGLDANVVIVGAGPLEAKLRDLSRDVPNVHLTGGLAEEDLIAHLAAADCFVSSSTSRAESFGIAVAEAQAMALPAVVTELGTGTVEAIEPGRSGLAIPPGNPRTLREALASLLGDPGRLRAMGEEGRRRAVSRHALADRAEEWRALYAELARSASTASTA